MDIMTIIWMVVGLVLLVAGAEGLVRGASKIATSIGISSLVVGLTVVSVGTGSPELAVSLQSVLGDETPAAESTPEPGTPPSAEDDLPRAGDPDESEAIAGDQTAAAGEVPAESNGDVALGNVVGSNIFNILVILGLCGLVTPMRVSTKLIRVDVPILIGISVLAYFLSLDGLLGPIDGTILVILMLAYFGLTYWISRKDRKAQRALTRDHVPTDEEKEAKEAIKIKGWKGWVLYLGMIAAGLVGLVIGANLLVGGAVLIAESIGISKLVVGLTVVAAGTGLPEAATSVVAALRGEREIAVGNAVGSSIFNIVGVLGITAIVAPTGIPVSDAAIGLDLPVMIAVTVLCMPIFLTGFAVSRIEGGFFLAAYLAYTVYLVLVATNVDTGAFQSVLLYVVLPATILLTALSLFDAWRTRGTAGTEDDGDKPTPAAA